MAKAKSATTKKQTAKKKSVDPRRTRLEKELREYISKIDVDGLIFLLKQAHVILHNMEADRINQEIVEYENSKQRKKPSKSAKKSGDVRASSETLVEIKPQPDGKSFIIVMNNARKIFSLDEMRNLVSICGASSGDTDASSRLYRWFVQNRQDVLGDVGIGNTRHPVLPVLFRLVKKTYKSK